MIKALRGVGFAKNFSHAIAEFYTYYYRGGI
jgi:hypothetical protein